VYIVLDSMYVTMSISTGLYPKLDLWKMNKLHYIFLMCEQTGWSRVSVLFSKIADGK